MSNQVRGPAWAQCAHQLQVQGLQSFRVQHIRVRHLHLQRPHALGAANMLPAGVGNIIIINIAYISFKILCTSLIPHTNCGVQGLQSFRVQHIRVRHLHFAASTPHALGLREHVFLRL
jgi:hypothetical protein